MKTLQISLFGRFSLQYDDNTITLTNKAKELLGYLLLYLNRPHYRESLVSQLWGNDSEHYSNKHLRYILWQLKTSLDSHAQGLHKNVLLIEDEWIQINQDGDFWLDVSIFKQILNSVQGIPGRMLDAQSAQSLDYAAQLFKGDLFEGWYHDWATFEREQYRRLYLALVDKLMEYHESRQEYEACLAYGARLLHFDKSHERTHRRLMQLYYLLDDRTSALRQYELCVAALETQLGVKPAQRTVLLYEQIQKDRLDNMTLIPIQANWALTESGDSLHKVLGHLMKLRTIFGDSQVLIQQEIDDIETALKGKA